MNEIVHNMEVISSYLDEAIEYSLLTEVVFSALEAIKCDPTLTPAEAIIIGYDEWVK